MVRSCKSQLIPVRRTVSGYLDKQEDLDEAMGKFCARLRRSGRARSCHAEGGGPGRHHCVVVFAILPIYAGFARLGVTPTSRRSAIWRGSLQGEEDAFASVGVHELELAVP